MRRTLLLLAAALAAPLLAAPASANIYCGEFGPIDNAYGPVCTVKCAMTADPQVDPSSKPPVRGLFDDPCWIQD